MLFNGKRRNRFDKKFSMRHEGFNHKKNVLFWVLFRHGSCSHGQYKNLSS